MKKLEDEIEQITKYIDAKKTEEEVPKGVTDLLDDINDIKRDVTACFDNDSFLTDAGELYYLYMLVKTITPDEQMVPEYLYLEEKKVDEKIVLETSKEKKDKYSLPGEWQRLWIRHCVRPEADFGFHVLRKVPSKSKQNFLDRETTLQEIAKPSTSDDKSALAAWLKSSRGISYYKTAIRDWYIQRYNIEGALSFSDKWVKWFYYVILVLLFINFLLFIDITVIMERPFATEFNIKTIPLFSTEYQITFVQSDTSNLTIGKILGDTQHGWFLWVEIFSIFLFFCIGICMCLKKIATFMFPRVIGAIGIGLLPLAIKGDMWCFPLRLSWGQIGLIFTVTFIVSLIYLTIECRKTTFLKTRDACLRAFPIAFYGISISTILSLIVCDLVSLHFVVTGYPDIMYKDAYQGLFGAIYPKIVVFFASISFMLGIFIQLFWQEKTVTQPL